MAKVRLDPETQSTIFDEIALEAQRTIELHPIWVGELANQFDFANLIQQACAEMTDNYEDGTWEDTVYSPLVDLASAALLWLLWLRQRNQPASIAERVFFQPQNARPC